MTLSPIALCSRALLKLGAPSIASFDEGTAEAEVAAALYDHIRNSMLCAHPWSFATGQVILSRSSQEPENDHAYAYQLPADFLRALPPVGWGEYQIVDNLLHTSMATVALDYIFLPDEVDFPPIFDFALIARLAAEFCIPLTESAGRSEALNKLAEIDFSRAKTIDAQQDTPEKAIPDSKHTPWTIVYENDVGPRDEYFIEWWEVIDGSGNCAAKCDHKEIAAFIVRACNSHDELVGALEQVMGWISAWNPNFEDDPQWLEETRPQVNSVLAKAKGES